LMQLFLRGICQPVRNTFDSHSMLVLILVNIKYCERQASMSTTSTSTYPTWVQIHIHYDLNVKYERRLIKRLKSNNAVYATTGASSCIVTSTEQTRQQHRVVRNEICDRCHRWRHCRMLLAVTMQHATLSC